jgi:hypothetical protein
MAFRLPCVDYPSCESLLPSGCIAYTTVQRYLLWAGLGGFAVFIIALCKYNIS